MERKAIMLYRRINRPAYHSHLEHFYAAVTTYGDIILTKEPTQNTFAFFCIDAYPAETPGTLEDLVKRELCSQVSDDEFVTAVLEVINKNYPKTKPVFCYRPREKRSK